jgi:hypothetical protein
MASLVPEADRKKDRSGRLIVAWVAGKRGMSSKYPYEVWTRDEVLANEGAFETLLGAVAYARSLGEDCLILDTTKPSNTGAWVAPSRVVATVVPGEIVFQMAA